MPQIKPPRARAWREGTTRVHPLTAVQHPRGLLTHLSICWNYEIRFQVAVSEIPPNERRARHQRIPEAPAARLRQSFPHSAVGAAASQPGLAPSHLPTPLSAAHPIPAACTSLPATGRVKTPTELLHDGRLSFLPASLLPG